MVTLFDEASLIMLVDTVQENPVALFWFQIFIDVPLFDTADGKVRTLLADNVGSC